tara:strand:- start:2250 stop:3848 length:1599 start_codon:yes stop_codon:yes gene_type:complete
MSGARRGDLGRASAEYSATVRALRLGDVAKAKQLGDRLVSLFPESVDVLSLQAAIAVAAKDYRGALKHIENAEKLEPDNASLLAHKASNLASLRDFAAAVTVADRAMVLAPDHGDTLATLGAVYTRCGAHEKSLACFQGAVKLAPKDAGHHYNLGTALRFAGDFEGAERCFDRTIKLRPDDYETCYARSGLRKQTSDNNHVAALTDKLYADSLPWRGEMLLCYALSKELEDLEEWDRSFACLQRGTNKRRENMRYDVQQDVAKLQKIETAFTSERLNDNVTGCPSSEPVFILGLPRAGSTLVERILTSHAEVTSAGELENFAIELMRPIYAKMRTTQVPIDTLVDETLCLDFSSLGAAYVDSTRHLTGGTRMFTDKMPLNFLYTGLIHLALPGSKIIHVHRDPMDACYAMYKVIFKGAYPFTYSLDDIGRYYIAYRRLMRHWNACLPGRILNVRYEDLVADQETQTRKLLDYCDLEWDRACLSFHESSTVVTTASAVEVRRPIYSTSIGKWKNYRSQLASLERLLREHDVDI